MADEAKPDREPRRTSAAGRQDGDYAVDFAAEPKGGPIPPHRPFDTDEPTPAKPETAST